MSEEESRGEARDEIQERIEQIVERIQNLRKPFRERRRKLFDALLGSLEKRAYERRGSRYNPSSEEEEVEKLKAEVENLKQQLEEMQRKPRQIVAIRGE
jgi:prefoldin subunit 5